VYALIMANDPFFSRMGIFGSYWFFPAYFLCNVIFFMLLNIKRRAVRIPFLLIILPALSFSVTKILGHRFIPWGIDVALVVLPFMWIGTCYDSIKRLMLKVKYQLIIIGMIAVHLSIIVLFSPFTALNRCYTSNYLYFYGLAILGFLWVMLVAMNIVNLPLGKVFSYVGSYTLPIFGMHTIIFSYSWFFRTYSYSSWFMSFVSLVLIFVLGIVLPIIFTNIIVNKSRRLKFLFLGSA